jgi:hypothetical protein
MTLRSSRLAVRSKKGAGMAYTFFLLLVVAATSPSIEVIRSPAKPVTVCEALQDLPAYNGKIIPVLGRWTSTTEGRWLSQDKCDRPPQTDGFVWPTDFWLNWNPQPDPELQLDTMVLDQATVLRKLEIVRKTTKLSPGDRWAVVYGRIETQLQTKRDKDGRAVGHGFGHLNGSPAQLRYGANSVQFLKREDTPPSDSNQKIRTSPPPSR